VTLLAPLTALLAAAVALPALLTLYFLKLRRRPVRVSSTMLWEQAVHDLQVNAPFRMIRPSWLLLLHLLILALLLIALGRPAIPGGGAGASRVFLLLDRSASMSAADMPGDRPRLDAAKDRAIELAESMADAGDAPEFTVVAFAADAFVAAPPSRRVAAVRTAINAIEPTDQPGRPAEALRLVESLVSGGLEGDPAGDRPRAVIISDGNNIQGPLISTAADVGFEPIAPAPDAAGRSNAGIVALNAVRDFEDPARVRVFVRLLGTAAIPTPVTIRVLRGEDALAVEAITIPAATPDAAGETARSIAFRDIEGGPVTVTLARTDALPADDTAWLVLPPPAVPRVLLVAPADPDAPGEAAPDPFLVDVLGALRTRGVRTVAAPLFAGFGSNELRAFDLIVFDRVTPPRDPPVASLSFGASLPSLLGDRPEPRERRPADGEGEVVSWTRAHPVTEDLALDAVRFGRRIDLPAAGNDDLAVRPLALAEDGPLIIEVDDRGVPRLLVAFPLSSSNWVVDVSFAIFMAGAVEHLTSGGGDRGLWYPTDAPAEARGLRTTASTAALAAVQGGPLSREVPLGTAAGLTTPLGVIERAGLYAVRTADGATATVAVNLADATESSLRTTAELLVGGEPAPNADALDGPREIRAWFVLAAGLLLLVEWLVYGLRMRV